MAMFQQLSRTLGCLRYDVTVDEEAIPHGCLACWQLPAVIGWDRPRGTASSRLLYNEHVRFTIKPDHFDSMLISSRT